MPKKINISRSAQFPKGNKLNANENKGYRNTGNPDLLKDFLDKNPELSQDEKDHLNARIQVSEKVAEIGKENRKEGYEAPLPTVRETKNGAVLPDIHLDELQSSDNGCWSCTYQLLLQSRGVNLSQEEIRAYRPNISLEEGRALNNDATRHMNEDTVSNPMEMSDLMQEVLPNTAMRSFTVNGYQDWMGDAAGIGEENYKQNAVTALINMIKEALTKDKSPVGMVSGGHFRTIVGIEGDEIIFKDSLPSISERYLEGRDKEMAKSKNPDPNYSYHVKLSKLVDGSLGNGADGIDIVWLKDVSLTKENNRREIEEAFPDADLENGQLQFLDNATMNANVGEQDERQKQGVKLKREFGDIRESGIMGHSDWMLPKEMVAPVRMEHDEMYRMAAVSNVVEALTGPFFSDNLEQGAAELGQKGSHLSPEARLLKDNMDKLQKWLREMKDDTGADMSTVHFGRSLMDQLRTVTDLASDCMKSEKLSPDERKVAARMMRVGVAAEESIEEMSKELLTIGMANKDKDEPELKASLATANKFYGAYAGQYKEVSMRVRTNYNNLVAEEDALHPEKKEFREAMEKRRAAVRQSARNSMDPVLRNKAVLTRGAI